MIKYVNPDQLNKNPAYSQAVVTQGNGQTIYIGGQNSVRINNEVIGKGNLSKQVEQVLQNIEIILTECGASFENIIKLNIYVVAGQNVMEAFQASQKYFARMKPPVVTVVFVSGLGNPDFLIEIEATAFVSDKK